MPEPAGAQAAPTIGAVTFLFTDIEGSTALWEQDSTRMSQALAAHDELARRAVERCHGTVVKMTGDGMHAAFVNAQEALAATVDLQQALADPAATNGVTLRVRCGLHAGVVERRDNDYFGSPVNRAARIMSAAHGGQVLLSQAVVDGLRDGLPATVSLRDLGRVRLKDLSTPEHVYQVVHPQLRLDFPALRSLEATPNNLPHQATSFIGRERELVELPQLLTRTRLLTLTGSGGCGKTRLGLQLAADSLEHFPDGAWLVELAPLADPELVPHAVARVLSLTGEPGKPMTQALTEYLNDKRLLLLLDNCEHLLDGCAQLVGTLVRQCPHVTFLASSREALGIGGEQTYRVPSLSLPDPKQEHTRASVAPFEAVQLFIDRSLLARPDFAVTDKNAAALASICCRLDGIPLAIELAAARVRSLSVSDINRKLDQRFLILTGGSRTALPRQQTLRSLIDWSYELLGDWERRLLQRLSVFVGGWTLEAAEQVCAGDGMADQDVLDLLTSLCDKSLVVVEQYDGRCRYRLLETVRQYAREKLAESGKVEALRERHRDHFLNLAEEAEQKLQGAEQGAWLVRLDDEHDNLRVAFDWSVETGSATTFRLCGALPLFWSTRGYLSEGRAWCTRALSQTQLQSPSRERAKTLNVAGALAYFEGDHLAARVAHEKSFDIYQGLADQAGMANSLNNLGNDFATEGDLTNARTQHELCLAIKRDLGDRRGIALSLNNLGNVVLQLGAYPEAKAYCEESLGIFRELGDWAQEIAPLGNLAQVAAALGDYPKARRMHLERLAICRKLGHKVWFPKVLSELAEVLRAPLHAARLWGAAQQLREEMGLAIPPDDQRSYDQHVTAARAAVGDDAAFEHAWQDGRTLDLEHAFELAQQDSDEVT